MVAGLVTEVRMGCDKPIGRLVRERLEERQKQ